jgi:hypothetical protein
MLMWIIVDGSPSGGFIFTGPFEEHDDALAVAGDLGDESWWIAPLDKTL